jgi:hypothetical protein
MTQGVFKLICLARDFSQSGTLSMYDLLLQTGYSKAAGMISEGDIYMELADHPELIDSWLEYSENKRSDDGWYFKIVDKNKYLVGCLGSTSAALTEYDSKIRACANFIKYELDSIITPLTSG